MPKGPSADPADKRLAVHIDGELVALRPDGVSSFPELQQALSGHKTSQLRVYLFDILQLEEWDLRQCRLADRKAVLRDVGDWHGLLHYSDHHVGQGAALRRRLDRIADDTPPLAASAKHRQDRTGPEDAISSPGGRQPYRFVIEDRLAHGA